MDGTASLQNQDFSSVLLTEKLEITFSSIKTTIDLDYERDTFALFLAEPIKKKNKKTHK